MESNNNNNNNYNSGNNNNNNINNRLNTNFIQNSLKRELSPFSVPFIPQPQSQSQPQSSHQQQQPIHIQPSQPSVLASTSLPFVPSSSPSRPQQQQTSLNTPSLLAPTSLPFIPSTSPSSNILNNNSNNNINSNNLNINNLINKDAPIKVGKESIETLLKNRFHPKNNIRETVLSSLQSILIPDISDNVNNTKENIEFFYNMIINENNYVLKLLLQNVLNDTKRNLVIYNYNLEHHQHHHNSPTLESQQQQQQQSQQQNSSKSRRDERGGRGSRDKDNKRGSKDKKQQQQQQQQQDQTLHQLGLEQEESTLYLPFSNLLTFIKNKGVDPTRPASLPDDDSDNSYIRLLEYNLKLLVKVYFKNYYQESIKNHIFDVYEQINNAITERQNQLLETENSENNSNNNNSTDENNNQQSQIPKSSSLDNININHDANHKVKTTHKPQPIISLLIPTVLVSIGDIIKFQYNNNCDINNSLAKMEREEKIINNILLNEFKKTDVSIIESNLYLFECILSISISNEPTINPNPIPIPTSSTLNQSQFSSSSSSSSSSSNDQLSTSNNEKIGYIFKFNKDLFRKLISLVYSTIVQHQITLSTVFTTLVLKGYLNEDQIQKLLNVTLFKLTDPNKQVQLSYLTLLSKMVSYFDLNHQKALNHKANDISLPYKMLIMRSSAPTFFNGQIFKKIFDWILNTIGSNLYDDELQLKKKQSYDALTKYLIDLFDSFNVISILFQEQNKLFSTQQSSGQSVTIPPPLNSNPTLLDQKKFETLISRSDELIWFWAVWECSKYCIANRLKSPYGTAFQTFEVFERSLLQLNRDRSDFRKIKILLNFMDSLEKLIFSTVNGSVLLPLPNSKEVQFFKHNVRVSEDWFSRIRVNLLKASILSSSTPDIIRHASLRVHDIKLNRVVLDSTSAQFELEFCILHLANALQQLNETESLQGLNQWCDIHFGSGSGSIDNSNNSLTLAESIKQQQQQQQQSKYQLKLPWMKGVILRTQQKFEEAITSLTNVPPQLDQTSIAFPFVLEQIIKSYLDISNFTEVETFLSKYQDQIQQQSNSVVIYKETFIKTLGSFYRGDMEEAHLFTKRTESQNHQLKREQLSLGLLGNQIMTDELLLSIMVYQKDLYLQSQTSTSTSIQSDSNKQQIQELQNHINLMLQDTKDNILKALNYLGLESNVQTFQYLTQLKVLDEIENGVYNSKVVPINNQIGFLERLRRIRGHISSTKQRSDILFSNIPLTEKMIRLTRKFENYKFSSKLLDTILESHSTYYFLERSKLKYLSGKQIESTLDLIKYSQKDIEGLIQIIQPSSQSSLSSSTNQQQLYYSDFINQKFKIFKEIIKYLLNSNQSQIKELLNSPGITNELVDPEYYFKKLIHIKPTNSKTYINYSNWILNEKNYSKSREEEFDKEDASNTGSGDNEQQQTTKEILKLKHINLADLKLSVELLFKFLNYNIINNQQQQQQQKQDNIGNSNSVGSKKSSEQNSGGLIIRATLTILNILVCCGSKLDETFKKCLNELSSIRPFTMIIPQLFARLNHPDSIVQKYVIEILNRIGQYNPNKIIYQTIVASLNFNNYKIELRDQQLKQQQSLEKQLHQQQQSSSSTSTSSVINNQQNNNDIEQQQQNLQNSLLKQFPNYLQILNIKENLLKHSQLLIFETETLIFELGKITILWDDNWQYFLEQIQGWIFNNQKQWNDEYQQLKATVKNQTTLKHQLKKKNLELFQPIYERLKRLSSQTVLSVCNTPHEKWFIKCYFETINKTIRVLEKQNKPTAPFEILNDLIYKFSMHRLNCLNLYSINPSLALYRPTITPIPGINNNIFKTHHNNHHNNNHHNHNNIVSGGSYSKINTSTSSTTSYNSSSSSSISFDNQVKIQMIQPTIYLLPTKTKPKKISILGSDGNLYHFLLKGREDLHLDERIMQLLNIVDQLLMNDKKPTLKLLRTRNYSVLPLSQSSGLIQWVEGAVPLFSLYKNWYRNDQLYKQQQAQQQSSQSTSSSSTITTAQQQAQQQQQQRQILVRPVDIFYSKINPLLEKNNFNILNRSEWPKEILLQVYNELVQETPKWILQRELWFSSSSSSELFLKTQSYSRSLALMSVIGYVIGLGDRHLDNILIDLKTGEIVHIDYNICFEKGLELKIPEKVPFRMTQIFEYALGLTGIHGTFRETSIQILNLLRKNKDILLNLLETFIYDPLFDWKHSNKMNHINILKDNMNQTAGDQSSNISAKQQSTTPQNNNVSTTPQKKPITTILNKSNINNYNSGNNDSSQSDIDEEIDISNNKGDDEDDNNKADDEDDDQQQEEELDDEDIILKLDESNGKDTFKSIQGLTVVNQVRLKLEGTEKKLSVPDQIDFIIKEAMNPENLSQNYEGWCSWC